MGCSLLTFATFFLLFRAITSAVVGRNHKDFPQRSNKRWFYLFFFFKALTGGKSLVGAPSSSLTQTHAHAQGVKSPLLYLSKLKYREENSSAWGNTRTSHNPPSKCQILLSRLQVRSFQHLSINSASSWFIIVRVHPQLLLRPFALHLSLSARHLLFQGAVNQPVQCSLGCEVAACYYTPLSTFPTANRGQITCSEPKSSLSGSWFSKVANHLLQDFSAHMRIWL